MKHLFKAPVAWLLAILARSILRKYRPYIVMVTGSVGKTSTKDAVAAALSAKHLLRASEKSYNSEFGVPLTIIGAANPWEDTSAWIHVIAEAFALIFFPNHYPKLLVLEVGADRPGDLSKILRIAIPDAVVVTLLPEVPVHVEAYESPSAVRDEEFGPAYALLPHAPLIISADDEHAKKRAARLDLKVVTYGFAKDADVRLEHDELLVENGVPVGMKARVIVGKSSHELSVVGALGRQQLFAPAAALAASLALKMSIAEALKGLEGYVPPPGRARILKGKSSSVLIDDTYNSSPAAVREALGSLSLISAKRRVVVLGDMLELGRFSAKEHEQVGTQAAHAAHIVIAVGERAKSIAEAARTIKGEREVMHFDTSYDAAKALPDIVHPGDVVLIKGSQYVRMERIVKALLANSQDAAKLVRQDKEWLKR